MRPKPKAVTKRFRMLHFWQPDAKNAVARNNPLCFFSCSCLPVRHIVCHIALDVEINAFVYPLSIQALDKIKRQMALISTFIFHTS